jgi:hypothetical protein
MDLGAGTRGFRPELDGNARPTRHSFVQHIEADLIGDSEGQMMQSDVRAPIERDRFAGRFDLPQRHNVVPIGYEHRRIILPLAYDSPSKTITKEFSSAHEVANT